MDWPAIARILGERSDRPLVILDKSGRVRMVNRAMEQALGMNRFQMEGQPWSEVCRPVDGELEADLWIAEALRGALQEHEVTTTTRAGSRVVFRFEFSLVGIEAQQGLLITAVRFGPVQAFQGSVAGSDLDYEISVAGESFGNVLRMCADGTFVPLGTGGVRCHALLHGLPGPCADCPAQNASAPWPRTRVRFRQTPGGRSGVFEIATAEQSDAGVRVRVRNVPESTVGAIHHTKVGELADRSKLSPREREVLESMLSGRSIDDIAEHLGISARTVKHHQASVLQKLGADSRTDLFRLLF
jgi:PAS domain S-box-containing protein